MPGLRHPAPFSPAVLTVLLLLVGCRDTVLEFGEVSNPEVEIVTPDDQSTAFPGDSVMVEITARDTNTGVGGVRLVANGALVDELSVTVAPPEPLVTRRFTLTAPLDAADGEVMVLVASATNAADRPRTGTSAPVRVALADNVPPEVRIRGLYPAAPASGYSPGDVVMVEVDALDAHSQVDRMQIAIEGAFTDSQSYDPSPDLSSVSYLFSVQIPYNVLSGTARLTASAVDASAAANQATTAPMALRIGSGLADLDPPAVWISDPDPAGEPWTEPGEMLSVTVEAQDSDNLIDRIALTVDGAEPAEQEEDLWPDASPARYTFEISVPDFPLRRDGDEILLDATAMDSAAAANPGAAPRLSVRVTDVQPPAVTVEADHGPGVDPGVEVGVRVTAEDVDGLLDRIGFSTTGELEVSEQFDLEPDAVSGEHSFSFTVPSVAACGSRISVFGSGTDDAATPNTGRAGPVELTVRDDDPPQVSVIMPSDGDDVLPLESVEIQVRGVDLNCMVELMTLDASGAVVAHQEYDVQPGAPDVLHSFWVNVPWDAQDDEEIEFLAKAVDGGGREGVAPLVTVDVTDRIPPLLTILSVTDGDGRNLPRDHGGRVRPGQQVTVRVDARDPNSGIDRIELAVSGEVTAGDSESFTAQSPVQHDFVFDVPAGAAEGGAIDIRVTAYDASRAGNLLFRTETLTVHEENPPQVAISAPPGDTEVRLGETVTVTVEATDVEAGVARIEFSASGGTTAAGGQDIAPPTSPAQADFGFTLPDSLLRGTEIHIDALARDAANPANEAAATRVTVRVANEPPTLTGTVIQPASPYTDSLVLCLPQGYADPNGDPAGAHLFRWFVDSVEVSGETTEALNGALHFDRGQGVACEVTPSDGLVLGLPVTSSTATVINKPPSLSGTVVQPADAKADDELTCVPQVFSDADGDAPGPYSFRWFKGGVEIAGQTTDTLPASETVKGDSISCEATPNDGFDDGAPATGGSVTIGNLPPALTGAEVQPASPRTGDALTCVPQGYSDPDGDPAGTHAYRWLEGGVEIAGQTGSTLPSSETAKGEAISCEVTPYDGLNYGAPVTSAEVTVINTAPSFTTASVTPASPLTGDVLTCSPQGYSDVDGDPLVSTAYRWFESGTPIADQTAATLPAAQTAKGDSISCGAIPNDGTDSGSEVIGGARVIGNTPPSFTGAFISPASPRTTNPLTCNPMGYLDADGDAAGAHGFRWFRNAVEISGQTGQTLPPAHTAKGQSITCEATPSDGFDSGTPVTSAGVTIVNSPPSFASVQVQPSNPGSDDDLTCAPQGYSDPDGDPLASTSYRWFRGGIEIPGRTAAVLPEAETTRDDSITCAATPNDGTVDGSGVTSPAVVIGNGPPSFSGASIAPASPLTGDTLTCNPAGYSDPDGDPPGAHAYRWFRGVLVIAGQTGQTLGPAHTAKSQSITCEATPSDGFDLGAPVTSGAVVIGNTPPSIAGASLTPEPAYETTTLTCAGVGWSDADGDAEGYDWAWEVNGSSVAGNQQAIGGTHFDKNDDVQCFATPDDGDDTGATRASNVVTIQNSDPSQPTVGITPACAVDGDDLTCAGSGSTDPDPADSVSYSYEWYVDDVLHSSTAVVDAADTAIGEVWRCEVIADDGDGGLSPVGQSQVTIADGTWTQLSPGGDLPGTRAYRPGIYDPAGTRMVVFGGYNGGNVTSDLHELDLSDGSEVWTLLAPATVAGARSSHTLVRDGSSALLFAGWTEAMGGPDNDVWTLDLGMDDWAAEAPTGGPPAARSSHVAVLDSINGRMVVHGGYNSSFTPIGDPWSLDVGTMTWTAIAAVGPPSPRSRHVAVYDEDNERMVLFGGDDGGHRNDLWELTLDSPGSEVWSVLAPGGEGPPSQRSRSATTKVVNAGLGETAMVLFGGTNNSGRLNDLWLLRVAGGPLEWMQMNTCGGPPAARQGAALIWDDGNGRLILFGGATGNSSGWRRDVWEFR